MCKESVISVSRWVKTEMIFLLHLDIMGFALHQGLPYGLVGGHCYSVIRTNIAASAASLSNWATGFDSTDQVARTAEHDGKKLICCRNPWGKGNRDILRLFLTICTDALRRSSNKMIRLQRRLKLALRKDDTHKSRSVTII